MQMPAGPPSALELSTFSVAGLWARRGPADVGVGFLSCLQCSYPSLNRKRALFFFFFCSCNCSDAFQLSALTHCSGTEPVYLYGSPPHYHTCLRKQLCL